MKTELVTETFVSDAAAAAAYTAGDIACVVCDRTYAPGSHGYETISYFKDLPVCKDCRQSLKAII
jgi:hypothetical protein